MVFFLVVGLACLLPGLFFMVLAIRSRNPQILTSFIEAIMQYYAWLTNTITEDTEPDEREVEEVLQAYLSGYSK